MDLRIKAIVISERINDKGRKYINAVDVDNGSVISAGVPAEVNLPLMKEVELVGRGRLSKYGLMLENVVVKGGE